MTSVELASVETLGEPQLAAWRDLAGRAAEPNPFFEPQLLMPSLRHLDPANEVRLLTVREDERAIAVFPVRVVPNWKHVPVTALVAWRHDYSFLGTPLIDEAALLPAVQGLVEHVHSGAADLIVMEWVTSCGPVLDAFEHAERAHLVTLETFERALLERRDDGEYDAVLGRETRRRLAQRRRALEREVGVLRVVDHAGDEQAYERFLTLEAAGWKGAGGTALAAMPEHSTFFREVASGFAREGRLELRSLEATDGAVLAMSVRLVSGDGVFCFKVAYDERFRKFAPGLQLELHTLSEFHARPGIRWADSCTAPGSEFFESLFPQRRQLATIVLTRDSGLSAIMVRSLPILRKVRRRRPRGTP